MDHRHVAFGLALHSDFELPGMRPREGSGLPALRLDRAGSGEPRERAGAAAEVPIWRGRLGDGGEITIGRGAAGDLLFRDGSHGEYRLTPRRDRLECATARPREVRWLRTLLSRVLPAVSLAFGNEALHAAAVDGPTGAVAILAPSGTGKSTLATRLLARGLPHFTDDVLVLSRGQDIPVAQPGTPHVTVAHDTEDRAPLGDPIDVREGEMWTTAGACCVSSRPPAALFLYSRGPGLELGVERLPASPLHLAPYMLGIPGEGNEASRFDLYSDLVETTPIFALRAETGRDPGQIADLVERTLAAERPAVVGGRA